VICPHENIRMNPVKVESHYGQTVIIDQCPECGGIWFDHLELYSVKQGQADKIELLDVNILRDSSVLGTSELLCPRDRNKLVRFSDPFFPRNIIIARCPLCNGFWLNRGEFSKYQQYRESLQQPQIITAEEEKLSRDIEEILTPHKKGDNTDVMVRLGNFLSTPVDSMTWRPLEPERMTEKEHAAFNMVINAVTILLRLFIRV
jgi:Zn-finger nucleic acid-binding protein